MAIKQYSLTRDGNTRLSPNLRVREFACPGSDAVLIDEELVIALQCIREHFGKAVHITSGYRTAEHNAAVGGAKSSQHVQGRAADFWVEDTPVSTVAAYVESLLPHHGGVGRYPKDKQHPTRKTGWVHIDPRAGWKGLCRKGTTLLVVLVACRLDAVIGSSFVRDATVIAFSCNEAISIVENAGLMGVPIPAAVTKAIDVLRQKSERADAEKSGK